MRLIALLFVTLVLAACGSAAEETGAPASSGRESETASGEGTASAPGEPAPEPADEAELKPPAIVLVYRGEKQEAVLGAYCVDYVDTATGQGQGICSDGVAPFPESVTSVAPGDRVTFVFPEATFESKSVVKVGPLGCTSEVLDKIVLTPGSTEHEWTVDLEHGAYQLDVFARFTADDGRSGDVSGALGLTVAGPKKWDALGVGDVKPSMQVCKYSN